MNNLIISIILIASTWATAQQLPDISIPIDTVFINGNDKTKTQVILREIPFSFPDTLNVEDFLLIQNRVQNLFLFNQVEVYPISDGREEILLIDVKRK